MYAIVTYILLTVVLAIVLSALSLVLVDLYNTYLIRKYEKHCKHWCYLCKYKDRCDWYNR